MPDTDDATYRQHYRAAGEAVQLREPDEVDSDDGVMEIRLPIASTGEVRNEGDDPLTRDELNGMARQLQDRQIGVFPAHGGDTKIAGGRYSPFEKLGEWTDAGIDSRESNNVLMATARMPDPETLPAATGAYREGLAILKEQAKRGIAQDASIGWRDDESFPGGVDLMEASIVGIGADWRTNTGDEAAEVVAREAVAAGADPDELFDRVAGAVKSLVERRELTEQQIDLALSLIERFVDEQGDASVQNFDGWVWSQDDDIDPDAAHAAQTAIGEFCRAMSPMDEPISETLQPWLENGAGDSDNMTDDDTADDGGTTDEEQSADTESGETRDFEDRMLEMQQEQTDLLRELVDREDDYDDEDDEDGESEMDDEDEDDDEDGEQSADDPDETQDVDTEDDDPSDLEARIAELEGELEAVRDGGLSGDDVEQPEPDESQDVDEDGTDRDATDDEDPTTEFDNLGEFR